MSDTFQKKFLTGSANGLPILVNAITSGSANTITTAETTNISELWLSAYNYSNTDALLYLALGGVGGGQIMSLAVPAGRGEIHILSGKIFSGGVIIKAYASVTGAISILGFCNTIVTI